MVLVRPIREPDAEGFHAALDSVCRERKYLARAEAPPLESVRSFIAGNLRAGHPQFVAESEGRIVGWCDALPDAQKFGRAHVAVLGMGVVREHRGGKIGTRLLHSVIVAAHDRGLERLELVVRASNSPALALYRGTGFVVEGVKKRGLLADGVHDDLVLMALVLSATASHGTAAIFPAYPPSMKSRIPTVIVGVHDMARSTRLYRDWLGLPCRQSGGRWTEFDVGGHTLALHIHDAPAGAAAKTQGVVTLCIEVADLDATAARLRSAGYAVEGPTEMEGLGRVASFRDPDDVAVSLSQRSPVA